MSDTINDVIHNLSRPAAWGRVLLMLAFAVILYITGLVMTVLILAQALFAVVAGEENANLRRLGATLTEFIAQILAFLTYNTDARPFPFAPFPGLDPVSAPDPAGPDSTVVESAAAPGAEADAADISDEAEPQHQEPRGQE